MLGLKSICVSKMGPKEEMEEWIYETEPSLCGINLSCPVAPRVVFMMTAGTSSENKVVITSVWLRLVVIDE